MWLVNEVNFCMLMADGSLISLSKHILSFYALGCPKVIKYRETLEIRTTFEIAPWINPISKFRLVLSFIEAVSNYPEPITAEPS